MELLAAPPPELAPLADPSARGAASLLRPPGGGRAPPAALPFELLIGLLTEPAAGGELWPAGGKKLPLPRLDAAGESFPAFAALAPNALALPPPAEANEAQSAAAERLTQVVSALPVRDDAAAAALGARTLSPPPAAAADGRARSPAFAAELAAPVELVPTGAESIPLESAELDSADAAAAAEPAIDGLEALFSNDARVRAQLKSTATVVPRPGAVSAAPPPALAANAPPALTEANAAGARQKPQAQLDIVRGVDSLAAITPLPSGSDAPTGVASDWLPASHVHANGPAGTAGPTAPALPQAPVDTRMPDWHEAFAQRVQWIVDTDAGEARLKLNPPELGAVDVKISLVDDKTHVHLMATTAAARDELAQSLPRLRELFTVSGLELGSASVHDGRGGEHARPGADHAGHGDGAPREHALAPLAGLLDEPAAAVRRQVSGRIDVFA